MDKISKFIAMADNQPSHVIYKTTAPTPKFFHEILLMTSGIPMEEAEKKFHTMTFYTGVGRTGREFDYLNALGITSNILLLGTDLFWDDENISLMNATLHTRSHQANKWSTITQHQADFFKISRKEIFSNEIIKANENLFKDFLYDIDEQTDEFLTFEKGRRRIMNQFSDRGDQIFTMNWDDISDLISISRIWNFTLHPNRSI